MRMVYTVRIIKGDELSSLLFYRKGIIYSFFLAIFFSHSAFAAIPPYVDKAKIRLSILPGESASGDILIENPGPETRPMQLYLEDWEYLPGADGSKKFLAANTTLRSCASWITFVPAKFTLSPYGRQRIGYSVKVPPQAQGGYYAVLFFETGLGEIKPSEGAAMGAALNLAIRVGTLFYIEAKGTISKVANIENLNLKRNEEDGSLSVEVDFRNSGNVDITAGGSFHIVDKEGLVFARNEFNDIYTFHSDIAKLTSNWKEAIPKGAYDLVLTIDIGKAEEEVGVSRGPVIIKEAQIKINELGQPIEVGDLR